MLLSNETLLYFGPGAAAVSEPCVAGVSSDIKATGRGVAVLSGTGAMPAAHVTGLKNSPVYPHGTGAVIAALPKARARFAASIKVNELSQDDVTGAVLEARVEGGLSLKEAVRLLLALAAGNATGLDTAPVFKSLDGTKDRITGIVTGDTRTITGIDPS